jgi:DNA-directed RNA polymerase subunit RPC12/RpoP
MGPSSPGYSCAQCGKVHILTSRDTVRCTKCGYRIMFKLRTTQPILTVAR